MRRMNLNSQSKSGCIVQWVGSHQGPGIWIDAVRIGGCQCPDPDGDELIYGDNLGLTSHTDIPSFNVHQKNILMFHLLCVCVGAGVCLGEGSTRGPGSWNWLKGTCFKIYGIKLPSFSVLLVAEKKYWAHLACEILKYFNLFTQEMIITDSYYFLCDMYWLSIQHLLLPLPSQQANSGVLIFIWCRAGGSWGTVRLG